MNEYARNVPTKSVFFSSPFLILQKRDGFHWDGMRQKLEISHLIMIVERNFRKPNICGALMSRLSNAKFDWTKKYLFLQLYISTDAISVLVLWGFAVERIYPKRRKSDITIQLVIKNKFIMRSKQSRKLFPIIQSFYTYFLSTLSQFLLFLSKILRIKSFNINI